MEKRAGQMDNQVGGKNAEKDENLFKAAHDMVILLFIKTLFIYCVKGAQNWQMEMVRSGDARIPGNMSYITQLMEILYLFIESTYLGRVKQAQNLCIGA